MSFLTVPLCPAQHSLTHPELTVAVEMLSSVALINRALESGDMNTVWKQLSSSVTGLTNIEEENCQRWAQSLCLRSTAWRLPLSSCVYTNFPPRLYVIIR